MVFAGVLGVPRGSVAVALESIEGRPSRKNERVEGFNRGQVFDVVRVLAHADTTSNVIYVAQDRPQNRTNPQTIILFRFRAILFRELTIHKFTN